jgi:hypothetical protein
MNTTEQFENTDGFTLVGSRFYNLSSRESSHDYAVLEKNLDQSIFSSDLFSVSERPIMVDYPDAYVKILSNVFDRIKLFVFIHEEDLNDFIEKQKKIEKFTSSMSYEYKSILVNKLVEIYKQVSSYQVYSSLLSLIDYKYTDLLGFFNYLGKRCGSDNSAILHNHLRNLLCYLHQHKLQLSKGLFVPAYSDDKLIMDNIYPGDENFISLYQALQSNIHLVNLLSDVNNDKVTDSNVWGRRRQLESLSATNKLIISMLEEKELTLKYNVSDLKKKFEEFNQECSTSPILSSKHLDDSDMF